MEALLVSRLIKNSKELPQVLLRCVHYVFGADLSDHVARQLADKTMRVPSESTLSRARLKLDVLSMMARQERFRSSDLEFFVMLSTDSSPQGGLDYLMTLEDRVSRAAAGNLVLAGGDGLKWAADNVIETTQLPLALVGSGNADLSAKFEAVFHQAGHPS